MSTIHRPRVVRTGVGWQARCTCGPIRPVGPPRPDGAGVRADADRDLAAHLEAVAAPAVERCQLSDPRLHGVTWWESCQVCANQPSLFEFEID